MKLNDLTFGCHGIEDRCYKFKGKAMPFCARCLGASIGHLAAAVNYFTLAMLPIWTAPIGLLILLTDWYLQNQKHSYHSNLSRLITGIIGGYSVGLIIWFIIDKLIGLI